MPALWTQARERANVTTVVTEDASANCSANCPKNAPGAEAEGGARSPFAAGRLTRLPPAPIDVLALARAWRAVCRGVRA